uniref:Ig-like domain-containing protein n=1 Tax=Cyprinodon variegatus TaxID=28743 RepID=A0A3Q2CFV4_CYPVA
MILQIRITPIVTQQPNWSQMFRGETVTLRCEIHGGGGAQWTYEWIPSNSNSATSSEYRITAADSRNYRCRGRTGGYITTEWGLLQITVLSDPALPVTEGDPVTLSCRDKEQKLLSNVFFYHNNKLIHNDSREELKISAVSKSDEGFYKCEHSGKESPQSWMAVRVSLSSPVDSSFVVLMIVGPFIGIILIILLLLWGYTRFKGETLLPLILWWTM